MDNLNRRIDRIGWLQKKFISLSKEHRIEAQAFDSWVHSMSVFATAVKFLDSAFSSTPDLVKEIDVEFIEIGSLAHDLGRSIVGSRASVEVCPNHGLVHGRIGAALFRDRSFISDFPATPTLKITAADLPEALARVCERHTGMVGLTREDFEAVKSRETCHNFPLPETWGAREGVEGLYAETLEEKIIGFADFMTRGQKLYPNAAGDGAVLSRPKKAKTIAERVEYASKWKSLSVIKKNLSELAALAPDFRDLGDYR